MFPPARRPVKMSTMRAVPTPIRGDIGPLRGARSGGKPATGDDSLKRRRLSGSMIAALAAAALGCGGETGTKGTPTTPDGPTLLFVTNSNADWWNAVEKGMQDASAELKVTAVMKRNEGTTQGQVDRLKEALSLPSVKGVAVSVIEADAPGVANAMKALRDAGKMVVAIDSDIAAGKESCRQGYIGTNNTKAGEAAGRAAAAIRPSGGKVITFVGTSAAANARERKSGFFRGAGDKFIDTESMDDQSDKSRAATNVQTAVTKYPDAGVLLGLWSYNAPAIAREVGKSSDLRAKVSVVTFDLDEAAVDHLAKGRIDVSVCQNPYEMGSQGVRLLKALIDKDEAGVKAVLPDGQHRDTGVRVIVPTGDSPVMKALKGVGDEVITIDEMKSWLASKGLKSS